MEQELGKKLIEQRRFFENILSGMKDWVRVIDPNNKVLFINEPMKKQIGDSLDKECFRGMGKCGPCEYCISDRAIFEGKSITKEETVNGRIYSVVSSPIRDENNDIYCAVEVFRDVTEKKAMEKLVLEQNKKMKSDLNFAKQLQHKILPENGIYSDVIKIESKYIPSELLGGDVFDVIPINEDHIGLYIADVAGHGVTSSMMTMFIRQTLKNLGEGAIDPGATLRYLYHRYRELKIDDQYYITIFYGVYNNRTGSLVYSNAGHNCMPIVIGKDRVAELEIGGLPICTLFEDITYTNRKVSLLPGDKILFYTDGISEAYNEQKEFFQNHRVVDLCKKHGNHPMALLIEIIIAEINKFSSGTQKDDIAIMIGEII